MDELVKAKGKVFEELVGAVRKALEPNSEVIVGDWVQGPDRGRDLDVAVRGILDGKPHLTLVECKNWKRPVGIAVIDALDSKRHDLGSDVAIVYSNSGFTENAIRKADRVGIRLAAPLRSGDKTVRIRVLRTVTARRLCVETWTIIPVGPPNQMPPEFSPEHLNFGGLPIVNWIRDVSSQLLAEQANADGSPLFAIQLEVSFGQAHDFTFEGVPHPLIGMVVRLHCSDGFVEQAVSEQVSLGHYDVLRRCMTVPSGETYFLGPFSQDLWRPVARPPEKADLAPNTFDIGVTLLHPVAGLEGVASPNLDSLVRERAVTIQRPNQAPPNPRLQSDAASPRR